MSHFRNGTWRWLTSALLALFWLAPATAQTCTHACCPHHFKVIQGYLDFLHTTQLSARKETAAEFSSKFTRETAQSFLKLEVTAMRAAAAHFAQENDPLNQKAILAIADRLNLAEQQMEAAKTDAQAQAVFDALNLDLHLPPPSAPVAVVTPAKKGMKN